MGSFNIYFDGLIAHISDRNAWRAVLVRATGHDAILTVKKTDVILPIRGFKLIATANDYHLTLQNKYEMEDMPAGLPTVSTKFMDHVPSLDEAMRDAGDMAKKKAPDNNAKLGSTGHKGVAASLRLEGGATAKIDVEDCMETKAKWDPPNAKLPICLAKFVRYSAGPNGDTVRIFGGSESLTLKSTAEIFISNSAGYGNHFHEYAKFVEANDAVVILPYEDINGECQDCVPVQTAIAPELDCSNSRYP